MDLRNIARREDDVRMIQVDGVRRHVYIKFINDERMQATMGRHTGQLEYHHANGELSGSACQVREPPTGGTGPATARRHGNMW